MGYFASSALHAGLDTLLCSSKYRLQHCNWAFSMEELPVAINVSSQTKKGMEGLSSQVI